MKALHRKLWRDMRSSALLLTAVAAIMTVGVMCFIAMQSAYFNLRIAMDRYYRQCRMADFWMEFKKAPVADLALAMRVPGVAQWRDRVQFFAKVDLPDATLPINAQVLSLPENEAPVINGIVLRRGSYFTPRRDNEVILTSSFAEYHRLGPGDRIHVVVNGRRQELLVVGTAISSEFTYMLDRGAIMPNPARFGVFFVKRRFAEEIDDMVGAANQIVGIFTPRGREQSEGILRELERRLDEYGVFTAVPRSMQSSHQFLNNEIQGLRAFATVTPLIFLITAALVLNILLDRIARQQRTIVGTLKALGYEDGAIFRHFLSLGVVVGLVGGAAGSGLGLLASAGMTYVYQHFFEFPSLVSRYYPGTHAIGILVSTLCAVLGSMRAARAMLRLRPADAMRPEPPRRGGPVVLEHVHWFWDRLSTAWRSVLRNVLRGRFRTATTVFSSMIGAALLANGFMFMEAQSFLIDFQFEKLVRSDVDVSFATEQPREAWEELKRLPGVRLAEPVFDLGCTLTHGPYRRLTGVQGLLPAARLTTPRDSAARRVILPESGLVLSRPLARRLHAGPGTTLWLKPVKGDRRMRPVVVARISDTFIGMSAYANIHYLSRVMGEPFVMTGAQLELSDRSEDRTALYAALKDAPRIQSVQARRDMVRVLRDTLLRNQQVFIIVLVAFSGSVFFGSILNASFVNLFERRREVATLLALGYTPREVAATFLREALAVNLMGSLLGLPVAWGLVELTAMMYDTEFFRLPVVTAPWVAVVTILVGILFTLVTHVIVYRAIRRLPVREALNVRE